MNIIGRKIYTYDYSAGLPSCRIGPSLDQSSSHHNFISSPDHFIFNSPFSIISSFIANNSSTSQLHTTSLPCKKSASGVALNHTLNAPGNPTPR
jgi:hypothetical protein